MWINGFQDYGLLAVRVVLGVIFLYHGLPKLTKTGAVSRGMGMSSAFIFVLGLAEVIGGLGALLGWYTDVASILLIFVMLGALYYKMVVWHVPFSAMDKMGWEFDLMILAAAVALLLIGPGTISITSWMQGPVLAT